MKIRIFILLGLLAFQYARGQELKVESFEVTPRDLTARTQGRVDANGRKCGVVKIYVNDDVSAVRGGVIGDIVVTGLEKMIYLAHDTKRIELLFKNHLPLQISFVDLGFPTITGEMTYVMKLKDKEASPGEITVASNQTQTPDNVTRIRDEIKKAYDGEMYEKAMSLCKTIPEDPFAQLYMAYMYGDGKGVAKDLSVALSLMRKSAEQDFISAQYRLAQLYEGGVVIPKNMPEAIIWFRRAAEQGHIGAMWGLADFYKEGSYVTQDYQEAAKWYTAAAKLGNPEAQNAIGEMYEKGQGVPKDLIKAVEWYRNAAEGGSMYAQYNLGNMYYHALGVIKDDHEAFRCFKKAAENGMTEAMGMLGVLYENGSGVDLDYGEAVKWYRKGAGRNDSFSQMRLGLMYKEGKGVAKDPEEAERWFRKAAIAE